MGISWRNISDGFFKTGTVGAIAVAESDPNVVYVGMGEHAIRGVMTHSRRRRLPLHRRRQDLEEDRPRRDSQHISRIVVHPKNPDVVYVAAQGALYGPSPERGVFKSTDGGATWKNVLFVDDKTGAAELSMDATNPRIMYAAMWEHGRLPWKVISGGPGSGLYKSTDGGETWQKMTEGLPEEMGKMAIAVSRSNPDKVYALIESDSTKDARGLYVSTNAGKSWSQVTSEPRLVQRAWYYIELFIDPKNENTIYVLSAPALRSDDGGKTWETLSGTHGDYHDLWINPEQSEQLRHLERRRRGDHLRQGQELEHAEQQPTAQFYRINVDNQFPYRIYAGQQDNTSVVIASRELGERRHHHGQLALRRPAARARSSRSIPTTRATCWAAATRARSRCIDTHGQGRHEHHGGAHPVPRHGREGHEVPLQLERADHLEQARAEHVLPRRAVPAEDHGHGQDVEGGVARPDAQREGQAGQARRSVHQRSGGRRELRHAGVRRGVAAREGRDLDRAATTGSCS